LWVLLAYVVIAFVLGLATGALRLEAYRGASERLVRFAAIAFFVPGLSEELFFRAALLPDPRQPLSARYRVGRAAIAVALFVVWHPLNGLLLKTEARQVFLDPGFLMLATLLGCCATAVYLLTGSIWPSTFVHWLTVVGWKAFLGGRIFD
jgi:predicted Abi (CAAX) family protease